MSRVPWRLGREGDLRPDVYGRWPVQAERGTRGLTIHGKFQGAGIAVGNVRAAPGQARTPLAEVHRLHSPQVDVHPSLPDPGPAHAGEVGLAAHLDGQPAVEQVIPAAPLGNTGRIHRAD